MSLPEAIRAVVAGQHLSYAQMTVVMQLIMTGEATPAQIAALLVGLRIKGETVEEIAAAATVMRELSDRVDIPAKHLLDTCGTGGDGVGTFNISTVSAMVAAAAGANVAKHGNRSVTSRSGSADVLEAAGARIDLSPQQVAACVAKCGVGFMFAPLHHSATRHAVKPRKEIGVRTLFNVLGPLTNPAGAPNQVLGVFSPDLVKPLAEVLQRLKSEHVLVVHADDGLDEISIATATQVAELKNGAVHCYSIQPEDFGITRQAITGLQVTTAEESLTMINSVLDNQLGAAYDIVLLNAGAAIYAANLADTLINGVERAREVLMNGSAKRKFADFIQTTHNV
ncbi:MAG: anthranilate phosphoribosyltransferase [Gammaproteobacteria bacterium]|nr:anthranilate phosphoribosyltransferase [Gammaproteobacteria bacterium]